METKKTGLEALQSALDDNQGDIDFVEAVLARGGKDAEGMLERLAQLEDERGGLLDARDLLQDPEG